MPLAVGLLAVVTQTFVSGSADQRRLERRTAAINQANTGLERMTRELRQANWVYFTSSQIVDAEAMVRPAVTAQSVPRHVRYDCSTGRCLRYEGPPVPFPPPVAASWEKTSLVIGARAGDDRSFVGKVLSHDVFVPKKVDPITGGTSVDYLDPDLLHIALKLTVKGLDQPIEFDDGVSLRNTTKFAE